MELEFAATHTYGDFLEIDNIGECALIGFDNMYNEFIVVVDTYQGQTRILTAGPITPDVELLPKTTQMSFQQLDFSEIKIKKILKSFVRDLMQLEEVDKERALGEMRNLIDYMRSPIY